MIIILKDQTVRPTGQYNQFPKILGKQNKLIVGYCIMMRSVTFVVSFAKKNFVWTVFVKRT